MQHRAGSPLPTRTQPHEAAFPGPADGDSGRGGLKRAFTEGYHPPCIHKTYRVFEKSPCFPRQQDR